MLAYPAVSQSIIRKGYLVNQQGDTVQGWFKYKGWEINPKRIDFGPDSSTTNFASYGLANIRYFEITGYDAYLRAVVDIDQRPIEFENAMNPEIKMTSRDTVFLRILALGNPLNLYELKDLKPHYYISTDEKKMEELVYRVYNIEGSQGSFTYDYQFRLQLLKFVPPGRQANQLRNQIMQATYDEGLISIVHQINGPGARQVTNGEPAVMPYRRWYVGIHGGTAQLVMSGSSTDFSAMNQRSGYTAGLFIGRNVHMARNLSDITLQGELSFSMARYQLEGDHPTETGIRLRYQLQQYNISPTAILQWHFIRKENLRIYLAGEAALNVSLYGRNRFGLSYQQQDWNEADDYLSLTGVWPSVMGRAGILLHNQLEIGLQYQAIGVPVDEPDFNMESRMMQVRMAWGF